MTSVLNFRLFTHFVFSLGDESVEPARSSHVAALTNVDKVGEPVHAHHLQTRQQQRVAEQVQRSLTGADALDGLRDGPEGTGISHRVVLDMSESD